MLRVTAQLAVIMALLCLAVANIYGRATWSELEDGVLWSDTPQGTVASLVSAGSPAANAGLREGDVLLEIDRRPIDTAGEVTALIHAAPKGQSLTYRVMRPKAPLSDAIVQIALAPIPSGPRGLYYVLAAVGIFSLFVGGAVRFRRPDNQATLHFFWLTIAFFGMLAFSFSGRLDTLDWAFYWADVVAMLLLPPLFVHFALVFPERPDSWARSDAGRTLPLCTFRACCSAARGSRHCCGRPTTARCSRACWRSSSGAR